MKKGSDNMQLVELVRSLSKPKVSPIYKAIAYELDRPRRQRAKVNIGKLDAITDDGETIVVPGKVLSAGPLKHKLNVAALSFSKQAELTIKKVGGKAMSIAQLVKDNPKGTDVAIVK